MGACLADRFFFVPREAAQMSLEKAKTIAKKLRCSPSQVYEMAERGDLPCVRFPRGPGKTRSSVRFDPEAIERWISKHSEGQVPETDGDGRKR